MSVTRAGRRTETIGFERKGAGVDEYNEATGAWGSIGTAKAAILWGRGDERREAAREGGRQAASFVVLSTGLTRSVTIADRLTYAGASWDIGGIVERGRTEIEFNAARAV